MRIALTALAALALAGQAVELPAQSAPPPFHSVARFVQDNPALTTQALEPGRTISGAINGPQVRRFAVDLQKGQFAAIRLNQTSGDLILNLFGPDGKLIEIVDQNTIHETETGIIVAPRTGRYIAQVAQFDWQAGAADFAITLTRREPLASTPQGQADQLMEAWYDPAHPGAAVVVLKDGKPVYRRTIGLADVEQRIPITRRTRFELASVSKQFTGYAAAMLIADGRLSRDDDVRKYLPELADLGAKITVGQLLDHTSGLRDWDAGLAIAGLTPERGMTVQNVLDFAARQRSLNFVPGSQQLYSNTGYALLGEIITRVAGQRADRWMADKLFAPLGMADTRLNLDPAALTPGKAQSYEGRIPATGLASGASSAAGGSTSVYSSLDDLVRWLANLDSGRVGGPAVLALMARPADLPDGKSTGYAFGQWHGTHRGLPSIGHLGLVSGFRTRIERFPGQHAAIIFLSNDGDDAAYARSERIEELFLPVEPRPPVEVPSDSPPEPAAPLPPIDLASYAGLYWSDEMATGYSIAVKGDRIVASHPINGAAALTRTGAETFSSGRWYMPELKFSRDAAGKVTGFTTGTDTARNMAFRRL